MEPISLKELASELEVSLDTMRNWQRLGVVTPPISLADVDQLRESLIQRGKLSTRANKLQKRGVSTSGEAYESSLEEGYRNREGIYYTPQDIVEDMISHLRGQDLADKLFLDPCCGSGNFLVEAAKVGFSTENIYGFDIDPQAVAIARERVVGARVECGDFLELSQGIEQRFDYIYTNPPWGRYFDVERRKVHAQRFDVPYSADSSAIFWVEAKRLLRVGGEMGFLIQEAVFNVGAFEWLRERVLELGIRKIKDYGRPFKGLVTRAQSIVITNIECELGGECECCFGGESYWREVSTFVNNPKKVINFWATPQDIKIIEKIYAAPHKRLTSGTRWGLGVVTGDNNRHCSTTFSEEFNIGVVKGSDIKDGEILPPTTFINGDLQRYQQSASREIYDASEKLIYKFISKRLSFVVDREQRYPLNSANCLVVDREFGASSQQVAQLLNSEVINWLFEKIFRSHKILRSDVEMLPIHIGYFAKHRSFNEDKYCKYLGIKRIKKGE